MHAVQSVRSLLVLILSLQSSTNEAFMILKAPVGAVFSAETQ